MTASSETARLWVEQAGPLLQTQAIPLLFSVSAQAAPILQPYYTAGGVISSTLDFMGGLVAFLGVRKTMQGQSVQAMAERFAKIGTIDMRIDYLRPGIGEHFIATGYVLRTGNKVAVTRMELHNNERQLIAVGTGAYTVA